MRGVRLGGLTAALMVGLGVAVATARGADDDGKPPAAKGLLSDLFGGKSKSPGEQGKRVTEEIAQTPPPPSLDSAAAQQQRHMNAWMRRAEVCDRLRLIAEQTGNDNLLNQANELEERATAIYRLQVSGMPLSAPAAPSMTARSNSTLNRPGPAPSARKSPPDGRVAGRSSPSANRSASRLNGSFDQREQAILNGSSMGGN